jgi:hypothetical protein
LKSKRKERNKKGNGESKKEEERCTALLLS